MTGVLDGMARGIGVAWVIGLLILVRAVAGWFVFQA
jgi:hypothetical protein